MTPTYFIMIINQNTFATIYDSPTCYRLYDDYAVITVGITGKIPGADPKVKSAPYPFNADAVYNADTGRYIKHRSTKLKSKRLIQIMLAAEHISKRRDPEKLFTLYRYDDVMEAIYLTKTNDIYLKDKDKLYYQLVKYLNNEEISKDDKAQLIKELPEKML